MMQQSNENRAYDPLGLQKLEQALASAGRGGEGLARVNDAFAVVMSRYTALQDRYRLLKAANRQLAEEVAWLRDQCDDFALELAAPTDPSGERESRRER